MKVACLLSIVVTLGIGAVTANAADEIQTQLKGLRSVKVNITGSQVLADAGFPGAQLRTQTELQLRKAGIQVDNKQEGPYITIDVTGCNGPGTNVWACAVTVSVFDVVTVPRNGASIYTQVWGPDLYVLYLPNGISQPILETAQARLDLFINDLLQANPPTANLAPANPTTANPPAAEAPSSQSVLGQLIGGLLQANSR